LLQTVMLWFLPDGEPLTICHYGYPNSEGIGTGSKATNSTEIINPKTRCRLDGCPADQEQPRSAVDLHICRQCSHGQAPQRLLYGPGEGDPVGVEVGGFGGSGNQGADAVVDQEPGPDFLVDQVW